MLTLSKSIQALTALNAGEKGENLIKRALKKGSISFQHNKHLAEVVDFNARPDFVLTLESGKKVVVEVRTQNSTGSAREKNVHLMHKLSLIGEATGYETFLVYSGTYLDDWMATCPVVQSAAAALPHVQVLHTSIFIELIKQGIIK